MVVETKYNDTLNKIQGVGTNYDSLKNEATVPMK